MRSIFHSSLIVLALFAGACSSGGGSGRTLNATGIAPAGPANQTTISLVSAAGAGTITVPVELANRGAASPSAVQFDVGYDTSRLQITAVRVAGNAVGANKDITVRTSAAQQKSRIIIFGMNDTALADGLIAEIDFSGIGAPGNVPLSVSKTLASAGDASLIATAGAGASATIQ